MCQRKKHKHCQKRIRKDLACMTECAVWCFAVDLEQWMAGGRGQGRYRKDYVKVLLCSALQDCCYNYIFGHEALMMHEAAAYIQQPGFEVRCLQNSCKPVVRLVSQMFCRKYSQGGCQCKKSRLLAVFSHKVF